MTHNVSESGAGQPRPDGAGSSEDGEQKTSRQRLGRRALLTRGGVVAAGVVGAGAVAAVAASPAAAQATTAVDMNTANNAGTNVSQPTELDADNPTAPALILANTGQDTSVSATDPLSGPNLRLTMSAATGAAPTASTAGGDVTATFDGQVWFTHDFSNDSLSAGVNPIQPGRVYTEVTADVFAPLDTPVRILDTRSASGRANILNPSALASSGQIPSKAIIYISLDSLTFGAYTVFANVTATSTTTSGFLTVWSGYTTGATNPTAPPTSSNINWESAGVTIANFTAAGVGVYPPGQFTSPGTNGDNVVAIFADTTTHVIMDVIGFAAPGFEYVNVAAGPNNAKANSARLVRLARAQAKLRNAKLNSTKKAGSTKKS